MKTTVLFIALLFTGTLRAQDHQQDRIAFVAEFMEAVITHNEKQILKHIEKSYRKEQIRFLKGNKVQFINELFAGMNENETFVTPDLNDISGIELIDIKENSDGNYTVHSRLRPVIIFCTMNYSLCTRKSVMVLLALSVNQK